MSPSANRARKAKPRTARQRSALGALVIAVAGAVLPGTAYLLAGRIRLGLVVTGLSISLLGGSAYAGLARRDDVIKWAPDPGLLLWVILGLALVAIAWIAVVISSYRCRCRNRRPR